MASEAAPGKPLEGAPRMRTACASIAPGGPMATSAARARPAMPGWLPTLTALVLIPGCLKLGAWQWDKADLLVARHTQQSAASGLDPRPLPAGDLGDPAGWLYRPVIAAGEYLAGGQILLDNQVREGRAGVSVITPLRLGGGDRVVLVDRGWLPAASDPRAPLAPPVPAGARTVRGIAWPVDAWYFALARDTAPAGNNARWQQLDLARYAQAGGHRLQPLVIRLAPEASDGFARNWPAPVDRAPRHRSYALQWFAFAATIAALWLGVALRALLPRRRPRARQGPEAHT